MERPGQEGASVSDPADGDEQEDGSPTAAAEEAETPEKAAAPQAEDDGSDAVSQSDIEALLAEVQSGVEQANDAKPAPSAAATASDGQPFELNELEANPEEGAPHPMELLGDVELDMRIELGRTHMRLEEVLHLRSGSVVALDKLAGDPVDVYVNGRLVARGEVLVMNDSFCVRVTELVGAGV